MDIHLIEIPQNALGFDGFIGSWAICGGMNILVDVGPANSTARLIGALGDLHLDRIDYILITHIHIDHAGGLASLLDHFPMARTVCHEKAIPLITNPAKLWAGSLAVLGKTAELYGMPRPVPPEKLIPHTQCRIPGLVILETPGHAVHHVSYFYKDRLFAGEAAGNCFPVGEETYLRPATPHRFFMAPYLESLDRLLSLENGPLCYAHFGEVKDSHPMIERFRAQLFRWEEVIRAELLKGEENPLPGCLKALMNKDPELSRLHQLPPPVQEREMGFLINSIHGFIGFLCL